MYSKTSTFSHIYIETCALDHPRTQGILKRFPKSTVVEVDDYQNVFGRGKQNFWRQKASPKLILGIKKDNFLYEGNEFLQANLSPNFCYNALVLNCPYDCHYCYLQGMYGSANVVAFVNMEEYFKAAENQVKARPDPSTPMPLAISYDSDLLSLEGVLGYVKEWVDWSRGQPDVLVEVRTKSAGKRFFLENEPSRSVRMAWTLSPDFVCRQYESGAPGLDARLEALNQAVERGWRISLCLDPILKVKNADRVYREFMDRLSGSLPWEAVERVELGVFRVSTSYFKHMLKRPDTDLLHYPYEHANNAVSYNEAEKDALVELCRGGLMNILSEDKIHIWT
ncbi:DNA photolyase [Puniceicoccales bacterium CK1056]|uniref:DNA photolyase n=1 Tax=Oceanipulchritudo coccoides TaxID=2706888 RepID=A0A6B2M3B6_9BACT|nr:DNA photolyase [Oceanipulchritudo coccoides]NDV62190.1 DNA photolyase [Oceanipulchritudo coccoides]